MVDYERKLEQNSARITLARNLTILLDIFAMFNVIAVLCLPDVLVPEIRIWLISVVSLGFIIITIGLIMARNDSMATLFFTLSSVLISGIAIGISIMAVGKIIIA